jgi:hypothetical protein
VLEVHHLERYRHRISIDGRPLFYYALVDKKESDIAGALLDRLASELAGGQATCASRARPERQPQFTSPDQACRGLRSRLRFH